MSIYLRLKELRKEGKLSQKEFSAIIKIDDSQYSKIERGILQATLSQLMDVSSNFNVSMDWLCFGIKSSKITNNITPVVNDGIVNQYESRLQDKDKIISGLERENTSKDAVIGMQSKETARLEQVVQDLYVQLKIESSVQKGAMEIPNKPSVESKLGEKVGK